MAIPSIVGHAILGSGLHIALSPLSSLASPIGRGIDYLANSGTPNLLPDIAHIVDAFARSDMTDTQLERWLRMHGVDLEERGRTTNRARLWRKVIGCNLAWPSLDLVLRYTHRYGEPDDIPTASMINTAIEMAGYKDEAALLFAKNVPWDWTPEQIRVAYALGFFSRRSQYRNWLRSAGLRRDEDLQLFDKLIQPPTYHECVQLLNRDIITPEKFREYMALEGFTDPTVIANVTELRKEIPTTADLIAMSVKNVFDKHLAATLRLDDEYEEQPQYIVWTDRTGFTGNPTISREDMRKHLQAHRLENLTAGQEAPSVEETDAKADEFYEAQDRTLKTWAQAHWREHWVNLSPTQIYEGLHRCRVIDLTRPGAASAQREYDNELEAIEAGAQGEDTVEGRYEVAERYARRFGRILTVPGSTDPVPPVTMDIVRTVLRANDYAPLFRDTLASISYNVLRLVDIRRIVQLALRDPAFAETAIGWKAGRDMTDVRKLLNLPEDTNNLTVYVHAWAREQFLDRGQTPDAAQSLAVLSVQQGQQTNNAVARASNPAGRRRWVRLLEQAYDVGVISADNFQALIGQVKAVNVDEEVYADVFASDDLADDAQVDAELQAIDDMLTAEDYADDAVSEELAGVS